MSPDFSDLSQPVWDAVILGSGLAGLSLARRLSQGGARVLGIERRNSIGSGASGKSLGVCARALQDSPLRLEQALGMSQAREVLSFTEASLGRLRALQLGSWPGGLYLARAGREEASIDQELEAAARLGWRGEAWSQEELSAQLGSTLAVAARWMEGEGIVDPRRVVERLYEDSLSAGASWCTGVRVERIEEDAGAWALRCEQGTLRAELILLAGGWEQRSLHPFLERTLIPVRQQALRCQGVAPAWPWPIRDHLGYLHGARDAQGRWCWSGARWATPHLEQGETRELPQPQVGAQLRRTLASYLPQLTPLQVEAEWAGIQTGSCDGLPLVGALPGEATLLSCTAWEGRGLSLALESAERLAGLLLGEELEIPDWMSPGRML